MFEFVQLAQITAYFTTSLDAKLKTAIDRMKATNTFGDFMDEMKKANDLRVTSADIDVLLTLQYGNPGTLPVLQVLYPQLNYKTTTFHIDHIFPKSKFNGKNPKLDSRFYDQKNYLFNLQLLEGSANISKSNLDPSVWMSNEFPDASRLKQYKEDNYIDASLSMDWCDFEKFKESRIGLIRDRLLQIFK